MADGKIYIIVTDQLPGGGGEPQPGVEQTKEKKQDENLLAKFAYHKFFNLIESQAKQAVNYGINNIGNFTGDYVKQQHVQDSMEIVSFLVDLGTAAYVGLKATGSPWGAAIAVGTALIGKGVNRLEQIYAGQVENNRQNRQIAQLRTRAGLNGTNNGSRGTDQ